ncbi:HD-GYP domain-containing protein [Candidatus Magnetaquicoccus inordinatus]|uniref:HD-GYP domain-containing protein n=1 Tax=Candidatus Magnetaquicoccus inordinatus TaxID=2496818 RepID=UPI00102C40B8|nr:HD domain-containing phosphohydrolase [Candidatus Magnetaquicoccus inordinatus]
MKFSLNQFLSGLSLALDCVESELLGVRSHHGRRVAYLAMRLGKLADFSAQELFDIAAFSLLHDNGLAEESLTRQLHPEQRLRHIENDPQHCLIGEANIAAFPFQTEIRDVVRYHHEHWDGSGFFALRGEEIPLMAQMVGLADYTDLVCCFSEAGSRERVHSFLASHKGTTFSPRLLEMFQEVASSTAFWLDMQDPFIVRALAAEMPEITIEQQWSEILRLSRVFSRIIDAKSRFTLRHSSGLEEKSAVMADWFALPEDEKTMLRIAAALHDVGKLAIPSTILDKPGKLDEAERQKMAEHTYYTRRCLEGIPGFATITEWAANHHEKLNGQGYPYALTANALPAQARLLTVLDIYQALTEERPYRQPLPHSQVLEILTSMVERGEIDGEMVAAVNRAFSS